MNCSYSRGRLFSMKYMGLSPFLETKHLRLLQVGKTKAGGAEDIQDSCLNISRMIFCRTADTEHKLN